MAAPPFLQPKIAFNNRWHSPKDFSEEPYLGAVCLAETGWGCLIYGYCSSGKFDIYMEDNETRITRRQAYYDAISLALGIHTIKSIHANPCNRLICNCKIH